MKRFLVPEVISDGEAPAKGIHASSDFRPASSELNKMTGRFEMDENE